jgi:hypothetical protein
MPFNTAPKPGRGWDTKDGKPPKTLYLTDPEPVNVEIVLAHLRENPWTRYSLFSRGGELVEPNGSDLRVVTANKLRTILHNKLALQWHAAPSRSDEPPQRLIQAILERAGEEMPAVSRVSTVPAMFQDGIQDAHGLDEGTGVYFAISNDDAIAYENFLEVDEARKLLLEDLLGDFPFVSSADRANALAAMLVPFVRDVIDGPTPLHLIEKPTSRTGATLLARCLTVPFGGVESQWPKKEAEREKVILGKLRSGTSVVWFDNVTGRIDSPALNTV